MGGKGKKEDSLGEADNGVSVSAGKRKEKFDDTGASFCTKLSFFVLFFSFTLTTSLFLMDYKKGQLEQMTSSLPPEVLQVAEKVGKIGAEVLDKVRAFNTQVLLKVEELSRKVPIGDKTLADYIFFRKMQQDKEKAQKQAEKAAREAAAKKEAEAKAKKE